MINVDIIDTMSIDEHVRMLKKSLESVEPFQRYSSSKLKKKVPTPPHLEPPVSDV
jgi:hypothetical protein